MTPNHSPRDHQQHQTTAGVDDTADGPRPRRRAVIYTRTAGLPPAIRNHNHDHQEATCRREAQRLDLEVVAVVHDVGVPAGLDVDKPGWRRVLALVHAREVDAVLTNDLTRITRQWRDVAALITLTRDFDVEFLTPYHPPLSHEARPMLHLIRSFPPRERRRPPARPDQGHPRPTDGSR